jgi:tetratricopeptide (TPR) repeat protein/anti-sigma regulatory factor (Ser/Thr protein kinase)
MPNRTKLLCTSVTVLSLCLVVSTRAQDPTRYRQDWENPKLAVPQRFNALQDLCWYWKERNGDSARAWSTTFLSAALDSGNNDARTDAWNTSANIHLDAGRNQEAMRAFSQSRTYLNDSDEQRLTTYYNNIAIAFQQIGDHTAAIEHLLRSKSIAEAAHDTIGIVNALGNLGVTYALRGDNARSARTFEEVISIARAVRDTLMLLNTLGNLGAVYSEMGQLKEARVPLEESLDFFAAHPDMIDGSYATASINLGIVHQRLGNLDLSDTLLRQGMLAHNKAGSRNDVANAMVNLGGNALLRKHYGEAKQLCSAALATADSLGTLTEMQAACDCLAEAFQALGYYKEALHYHKRMVAAKDSLVNAENIEGIARMEAQFEFSKQQLADSLSHAAALAKVEDERTIEQLRADRNRNGVVAVGGGGLLLLIGALMWYRVDRKRRQERFEKEAATLETQALRSQMNPHFIFNALNSIYAYVQQNDQDSAGRYLTKFARVMRSVLENSRHSEVPLSEDLDSLRGYMELERMRMQQKFDFTIEVAAGMNPEEVLVPPLVVQPFVENAIWHGMARKEGQGHITLHVRREGRQLIWSIEDDGVGRNAAKPEPSTFAQGTSADTKKTSLGTAITRARLDLVQKQHGGTAGFKYIDLEVGTRVEVAMPLLSAN